MSALSRRTDRGLREVAWTMLRVREPIPQWHLVGADRLVVCDRWQRADQLEWIGATTAPDKFPWACDRCLMVHAESLRPQVTPWLYGVERESDDIAEAVHDALGVPRDRAREIVRTVLA